MQQAALHHVHGEIQDMNSGEEGEAYRLEAREQRL